MRVSAEYKALSRENLKGQWGKSIIVCLIVALATTLVNAIPVVGSVVALLIGGPLAVGEIIYFVKLNRKEVPEIKDMLTDFGKNFVGNFLTYLVMGLYTALWTLLLIVPGLIKTYSYAMTMFIKYKQPELGVNETITLSRQIMDGKKMKLFRLQLSFIGWILLSLLTLGIGLFFLAPYMKASYNAFYEDAYNEYMNVNAPAENNVDIDALLESAEQQKAE